MSSWSADAPPPRRRGGSLILKVALAILAIPFALLLFLLGQSKVVEGRAWSVIRKVAQRLQTEAGARRLYQANPALARVYGDEEAFLEQVRAHRAQFADLPDLPPGNGRYECFAGPNGFQASLQGSGGIWATVEVRQDILLEKVPGEGLLRLEFSPTKEASELERRAQRKARAQSDWQRYREVCGRLATDGAARSLWAQEPGLHRDFPEAGPLLVLAAQVRPHLSALPETPGPFHGGMRRQVVSGGPGGTVRLSYALPCGTLTLTWSEERLSGLHLAPRSSRAAPPLEPQPPGCDPGRL
ncbi:MAG: hypothetical protein LWW79_14290 [Holophagaceae bacterium]|nr:hypothetical protein [Holophagaceae bacterium]